MYTYIYIYICIYREGPALVRDHHAVALHQKLLRRKNNDNDNGTDNVVNKQHQYRSMVEHKCCTVYTL